MRCILGCYRFLQPRTPTRCAAEFQPQKYSAELFGHIGRSSHIRSCVHAGRYTRLYLRYHPNRYITHQPPNQQAVTFTQRCTFIYSNTPTPASPRPLVLLVLSNNRCSCFSHLCPLSLKDGRERRPLMFTLKRYGKQQRRRRLPELAA